MTDDEEAAWDAHMLELANEMANEAAAEEPAPERDDFSWTDTADYDLDAITEEDEEDPSSPWHGVTFDARRVAGAYAMVRDTGDRRQHRTEAEVAEQLGLTEKEVHDISEDLTARGLLLPATHSLTEDQKRVLYAMPTWSPDMPELGPTTAQLAERLEMTEEQVDECLRVLDEKGWMHHNDEPDSVLDALLQWGWNTPAAELSERLGMKIADVDQELPRSVRVCGRCKCRNCAPARVPNHYNPVYPTSYPDLKFPT